MSDIRILHYRDHNNGGQFDGNCYVNAGENISSVEYPVRVRFQLAEFDSGFQYIWGIGTGNNQYSLKIVRDTNDYFLRVTYLDVDYDFTDFRLGILNEITMVTVWLNDPLNKVYIIVGSNRYGTVLVKDDQAEISNTVTYSIPAVDFTIGGSRYLDGAVLTLDSDGRFTGKIFDWETHYSAAGADRQRLVFYENYLSVDSDTVADFNESYDATIEDRPSDFWSVETDITGYIRSNTDLTVKYRSDEYLVQEYASTKLTLFNYFDVNVGDTIAIEIDSEITWLFNVTKTKPTENGYSMNVECEDILLGLKEVSPILFFWVSYTSFSTLDRKWWSNYTLVGVENHPDSSAMLYVLKSLIYILQYDNLISVDVSALVGSVNSRYYDYQDSAYITFDELGYDTLMSTSINQSSGDVFETAIYMHDALREILFHCRLMYYVTDSTLMFVEIDSGNVVHSTIWNTEPATLESDRRYIQISCDVVTSWGATYNDGEDPTDWGDEYPSMADYYAFPEKEVVELRGNSLGADLSKYDREKIYREKKLIPHFWLVIRNTSTAAARTMWDSANSENFVSQLAVILENDLRRDFVMERITIPLEKDNSPKYHEKTDDLVEMETIIYQEVAE